MATKMPPKGKDDMKNGAKKPVPPNPPTKGGKAAPPAAGKKEDMKAKMDRLRAMKGK